VINDFIEYWTAAKLLLSGGNPYSPAELLQSEQAVGWTQPVPLIMWNPPWTLTFTLPIGLLDYGNAQFAWFLLHALIIFVGAQVLWQIYGGNPQQSRYAWLSVLTFAPTYFVLLLGQIGPMILLGLIGFLFFAQKKAWSYAAASLALVSIKPHLLYLLWLALFLWMLKERQWRAGFGLLVVGIAVAFIPLLWNTEIYSQYFQLLRRGDALRPLDWATPSLGTTMAELLAIRATWIRWSPSVAGGLWFLWYWSRHAATWDWVSQFPLVLLVSIVTASFAWTFDHVVLVPAVIQCAVWTSKSENVRQRQFVIAFHVLLSGILFVSKIFVLNDFWYFWLAPTFLLFYLYVRQSVSVPAVRGA
jgi:Glycosyltransferase family 87